ncbi:E3 ubiquitin-protein ligase RFWD3-like isoform X1 [Pogonomyrmex barbatus]|uniref:RING-type E3 ubiquitin transferase n=1 Tax=Pogonomyrmex barbatus TaxID=144034 RepID=A0A6I9WQK8_9HYME|nr:E3 ubiquitin-protein ligase RFWD3-like isoform X1 [Pogonomyrmex barbatus]
MESNENAAQEQMQVEEQAQIEEQTGELQQEDVCIVSNDIQNSKESPASTGNSEQAVNLNVSEMDTGQTCPICMERWTDSGEHRLCCLRCGHLFGHSCILRWLQHSCDSSNRRCPQCNVKANVKHIRTLYAKELTAVDASEYNKLKKDLNDALDEKNRLQMNLFHTNVRLKVYEEQVTSMKNRIAELESQNPKMNIDASRSFTNKKFYLERCVDIKEGGRVLDYNSWHKLVVFSQKSTNSLFNGFGIRKLDCEYQTLRQFTFLHSQAIRDMTFHFTQPNILLTVGFDKCAKLVDVQNNVVMHTYPMQLPLWSCCWAGDNPNVFLTGAPNGTISQFDIRQTGQAINVFTSNDQSPVVSMATVPPNPNSGICKGGFIACRFYLCNAYEINDATYLPKQMFLEGPFASIRYDKKHHHCLISSRPNDKGQFAKYKVCTIEKTCHEDQVTCNIVHTFQGGSSQHVLSRPHYLSARNDSLVAAHIESNNNISLWSVTTGQLLHNLPVSDSIMDLCSFDFNNSLYLTTLSAKKLRLYKMDY